MEYQAIETTGATESKLRAYCDAVDLKAAVAFIKTHVIKSCNYVPILDCVLIEGVGNSLRLTGTDLDLQASIDVAADIETPGRVAVAIDALATFLIKAAKASKGARVMIDQGDFLKLSSGRGNVSLATQKPDDFPFIADTLSAECEAQAFTLSAEYADRLASLHQFCSTDVLRENYKRAVNIAASDGQMVMSATDGANASIWRCDAPYGADGARLLIARKPVKSICAARDAFAKGGSLSVQSTETRVIVEAGYCRIIAKLCEYDAPADMPAKLEAHIGNATPLIIPDIDPLISPKAIALFDKRAGKTGLLWEGGERAARITRPDAPEWTGYASNLKADRADKGNRAVTLQVGGHSIGVANDRGGLTLSVEAVAKLCGDDLFAVIPVTLPADVVPYQSDRRAYVTKWLYLAGATKFRTVPADGKVYGEKTAWLRHPMTRDQVDACLSADQRAALLAESQIVAPEPEIRLVPADIFKRDYAAAWAGRDAAAMSEAIRAFRAYSINAVARHLSADDVAAETQHSIRKICAGIRGLGEKVKQNTYDRYHRGKSFQYGIWSIDCAQDRALRREANRRAKADWLASGALHPGDPRTIVQIEWTSGGVAQKGFAHINALRDPDLVTIPICRKTGAVTKHKASIDVVKIMPGINATERKQVADAIAAYDAAINAPAPVDADVDTPIAEPETVVALSDELADDICNGPMWKGSTWEAVFTDIERGDHPTRIDCIDGVYSIVNTWLRKGGMQRTRIPARHNERASAAFDAQAEEDRLHVEWVAENSPPISEMVERADGNLYQINRGRFGISVFHNPRDIGGFAQPSVMIAAPCNALTEMEVARLIALHNPKPQDAIEAPQDETATQAADEPEIAPQDEKNGLADEIEAQPDPVAALIARMDALEAIILDQVRPEVGQVDHPSVEITNVVPLPIDPRALAVVKARQEIADDTPIGEGAEHSFTVSPARYAKGKVVIHCHENGHGTKTRAMRIIGDGLGAKWAGRENAYIASSAQSERLQRLFDAGFDASYITGEFEHTERGLRNLSWREADNMAKQWLAAPAVAMETETLLSVQSKPKRSPAHVRAIMAYLQLRSARKLGSSQRHIWSTHIDDLEQKLASMTEEAEYQRRKKETYQDRLKHQGERIASHAAQQTLWESIASEWGYAARTDAKRRRAVLKARDLQNRLYAEYKIVDRANDKRMEAERELASLKQKLADPTNPARESDLLMLRDNAEKWQGKAEAAIAEGERLKQQVVHYGGQIENLAVRLARAEAMLRADPLQLTRIAA
jgi:hypothetical protein